MEANMNNVIVKNEVVIEDGFVRFKTFTDVKARIPNGAQDRNIEYISKMEIADAMMTVIKHSYGIDKDARFVFGDIMEEELKKGESAEALTVEGQKPDAVIPYEENGKKWYFWYFTDLQSDKEGNELEYTLKQ